MADTNPTDNPELETIRRLWPVLGRGNYHRIARGSGYWPQHTSRVLRGMAGCSVVAARRMADAAGVSLEDFLAFTEAIAKRRARKREEAA